MIHPLRTRHRRLITLLAVVLPVLYVGSLVVRPPTAHVEDVPAALRLAPAPDASFPRLVGEAAWTALPLHLRLRADADPPSRLAVELEAVEPLQEPDLLLYWSPGEAPPSASLPPEHYLLGAFPGHGAQIYPLPQAGSTPGGILILYSLGHRTTVGHTALSPLTN